MKPDFHEAWNNWGVALGNLAQWEATAGDLAGAQEHWEDAFAKHAHAIEVRPDLAEAWSNWSARLLYCWRYFPDRAPLEEARVKAERAEALKPGSGAYNLACAESLLGNAEAALDWLERAIAADSTAARNAHADGDFDPIRSHPRFKELVGSSGT